MYYSHYIRYTLQTLYDKFRTTACTQGERSYWMDRTSHVREWHPVLAGYDVAPSPQGTHTLASAALNVPAGQAEQCSWLAIA